jgi:hypothetical protein
MQYNLPPTNPVQIEPKTLQNKPECEKNDQSPPPGCGRRASVAGMAFQLHRMEQTVTDPLLKAKYRNAIASLGEILAIS